MKRMARELVRYLLLVGFVLGAGALPAVAGPVANGACCFNGAAPECSITGQLGCELGFQGIFLGAGTTCNDVDCAAILAGAQPVPAPAVSASVLVALIAALALAGALGIARRKQVG